ncbi:MAG: glycosyltransferase family 39 protein [Planctomycetota bacterium]
MNAAGPGRDRKFWAAAGLLLLGLSAAGLFDRALWTPDEPREAEISREMAVSGDWLVPHLSNTPFLEKPPAYYVLLAAIIRITGSTSAGLLRLPSAVAVLITALLTYAIGRCLMQRMTALLGAGVFLTLALSVELGHKVVMDSLLMMSCSLSLWGFIRASGGERRWTALPFWGGLLAAFSLKGLVGPVLVVTACGGIMLALRQVRFVRALRPLIGGLVVLAALGVWCILLYERGGAEFVSTFVVHNQFLRFLGGEAYGGGHERPFYTYALTLPLATLPWTPVLVIVVWGMLSAAWRARRRTVAPIEAPPRETWLLLAWPAAMLLVLSIAATKRSVYSAPVLPALALLAAHGLEQVGILTLKARALAARLQAGLVLLAIIAIPAAVVFSPLEGAKPLLAVGPGLAALVFGSRRQWKAMPLTLSLCALTALAYLETFACGGRQLDAMKNLEPLSRAVVKAVPEGREILGFDLDETTIAILPFYTGVFVRELPALEKLQRALASQEPSYVLMLERDLGRFRSQITQPFETLRRFDTKAGRSLVLIGNPPAQREMGSR